MMAPDGTVETLQQYKHEGVIGAIGVAGGPIDLMIGDAGGDLTDFESQNK